MGTPANTPPTGQKKLAQLGKEQALGEAKQLGCQGFEVPKGLSTTKKPGTETAAKDADATQGSGNAGSGGKTTIAAAAPGDSRARTIPTSTGKT